MLEPDTPLMKYNAAYALCMPDNNGKKYEQKIHNIYYVLIFDGKKWSRERTTVLRFTCITCLVMNRLQTISHSNPGKDRDCAE